MQRVNELYCTLILPSGQKPAAGWPVMILAHAGTQHKDDFALRHAAIAASHGIATLAINAVGHGVWLAERVAAPTHRWQRSGVSLRRAGH